MLKSDLFSRLGIDAETLMNQLSGAKHTGMDRDQTPQKNAIIYFDEFLDKIYYFALMHFEHKNLAAVH